MKITIKTLKGDTFPVELEPASSVLDLKNKIKEVKSFEIESQKIVFKGKATNNTDQLQKLGVKEGDFLVIMILTKKPQPKNVQQKVEEKPSQKIKEEKQQKAEQKPLKKSSSQQPASTQQSEAKITNLMSMGFTREKCDQALHAAFMNEDRAVEYLINGIPSSPVQPLEGAGGMGPSVLAGIVNNPQFAQMREMIRNDPTALQPILQQISQTSPQLYELIAQHPEEFERLILEGDGEEGQEGDFQGGLELVNIENPPPGSIVITAEEEEAINRLVGLGFPKIEAAQAYMACEKNEELAANLLFDRQANGEFDDEELPEGGQGQDGNDDDDNLFN